jgi:hypothetical protein
MLAVCWLAACYTSQTASICSLLCIVRKNSYLHGIKKVKKDQGAHQQASQARVNRFARANRKKETNLASFFLFLFPSVIYANVVIW